MRKKKDPFDNGEVIVENIRCIQDRLPLSRMRKMSVRDITSRTKNIWNATVTCCDSWHDVHNIQLEHFSKNIKDFVSSSSPNDRLVMARYLKRSKKLDLLEFVVKNSHVSETELFEFAMDALESPPGQMLTKKQVSVMMPFDSMYYHLVSLKSQGCLPERECGVIERILKEIDLLDSVDAVKDDGKCENKREDTIIRSTIDETTLDRYLRQTCFSYKAIQSQCAQQVRRKCIDAYSSFFSIIRSEKMEGKKKRPPSYLPKKEHFPVIFQKDSFVELDNGQIRLSMYSVKEKDKRLANGQEEYLYVNSPFVGAERTIRQIEIIPKHRGAHFMIKFVYDKNLLKNNKKDSIQSAGTRLKIVEPTSPEIERNRLIYCAKHELKRLQEDFKILKKNGTSKGDIRRFNNEHIEPTKQLLERLTDEQKAHLEVVVKKDLERTKKALRRIEKRESANNRKKEREVSQKRLNEQRIASTKSTSTSEVHVPLIKIQSNTVLPNIGDISQIASIDLGTEILASVYVPQKGARPLLISGKEVIHTNLVAKCKLSVLSKKHDKYVKAHYDVLLRRELLISNYMHTASRMIVEYLQQFGIKHLVIGYNIGWKTGVNMGAVMNERFYKIPYRKLIDMLFYKCSDLGIKVVENEEAYTSKCDSLTGEKVGFHDKYTGSRVKRGLFSSGAGFSIHADINGAINIMRKWVSKAYNTLIGSLEKVISTTHQLIKSPLKSGITRMTTNIKGESILRRCVVRRGRENPITVDGC